MRLLFLRFRERQNTDMKKQEESIENLGEFLIGTENKMKKF